MTKADPIIAVKNVEDSAAWYCTVFGLVNAHGGDHFAVLKSQEGEIILCLHAWDTDNHPTMKTPDGPPGIGLILYFRTSEWNGIHDNLEKINWPIEEEIHHNPNSLKQEFSFRDPDGYFITVTEFHTYDG